MELMARLQVGHLPNPIFEPTGLAAWLDPARPAGDLSHQLIKQPRPPGGVYAMASGHRKIIESPHNPR
jgi:hypothetical protein